MLLEYSIIMTSSNVILARVKNGYGETLFRWLIASAQMVTNAQMVTIKYVT